MVASCKQSERRDRERASTTRPELRALRPLQGKSPYVFTTEAGTPVTTAWFLRMVQRTGEAAKLPFPVHPHMLRHSTGVQARQRWPRHAFARALSRASQLAEHSQVYRVSTGSVCEVLERLGAQIGYVTTTACNSARHPLPLSSRDNL
jgi:integrase